MGNTGSTTAMRQAMPFLAVALGAVIVLINIMPRPRSGNDRPESSDTCMTADPFLRARWARRIKLLADLDHPEVHRACRNLDADLLAGLAADESTPDR